MEDKMYKCLVVDDEPIARKIVINYIQQSPMLQLAGECINALQAIDKLTVPDVVDIVFLDINMPNLTGLQLMKIVQPQQPVIFTTAYAEFAVESYDVNAVDYLLKPFSFERFTKAAHKAIGVLASLQNNVDEASQSDTQFIFIKSDGKNYPVYTDEILYCEAMKNYTMVKLKNGQKLMPLIPLSKFEMLLSEAGGSFIQVHRSFLVSKKHIRSITSNVVCVDQFEIPIGVQYKEKFLQAIGMKHSG